MDNEPNRITWPMTVGQLRKILETADDNALVVFLHKAELGTPICQVRTPERQGPGRGFAVSTVGGK